VVAFDGLCYVSAPDLDVHFQALNPESKTTCMVGPLTESDTTAGVASSQCSNNTPPLHLHCPSPYLPSYRCGRLPVETDRLAS